MENEKNQVEEWRDVVGYEGLYQVSSLGRVRSLDRVVIAIDGKKYLRKSKYLLLHNDAWGYHYVALCRDGGHKFIKVHRLVAESFLPNPNNLPQVNHKDEDKTNNRVENLEWCTAKYNARYGTRGNRIALANKGRIISYHRKRMKPILQYSLSGKLIAEYESLHDAERKTGVARHNISKSCTREREISNGYIWRYKEIG